MAASVRAKAMARRRAGAGLCRDAAALGSLPQALGLFEQTGYGPELIANPNTAPERTPARAAYAAASGTEASLAAAQHATRRSVLWQLHVLAGWLPVSGARMVRAAGAVFELGNITVLSRRLRDAESAERDDPLRRRAALPEYFDLGGLATAWPRLARAGTYSELVEALRTSPWGDPGTPQDLADTLTVVWFRRLAASAPQTRRWMVAAAALLAARRVLAVPGAQDTAGGRMEPGNPPEGNRLNTLLQPMIGTAWTEAQDVASFRAALPAAAAGALSGIEDPGELWRAEASLRAQAEEEAFALLRSGLPGPDIAVGAITVLAMDAWRVRAALAAAAAGAGSEVLDAVA